MTVGAAGARQSAGREVGALPRAGAKAAVRRMARDHLGRPRVLRTLAGGRTRGLGATSLNLLLDTHSFLWWLAGDRALSPTARTAMADEAMRCSSVPPPPGRSPPGSASASCLVHRPSPRAWALSSTRRDSSRYRYRSS